MTAQAVSRSQLKRLSSANAKKVDQILAQPGMGCALYTDSTGDMAMLMSYGTFRAEMPSRYPAGSCGSLALAAYCPPGATGAADDEMIFPVKAALQNPAEQLPQIPSRFAPPGQIRTEFPAEHGRTSPMNVPPEVPPDRRAIMMEREPAPRPQPAPETEAEAEAEAWWDRALGPKRR